jgi:plastocyanin
VALSFVAVPVAGAATTTISITKNGYVPSSSPVSTGDTVQFANADTVAHQVVFKPTTGVTCSPSPFTLQPAQSGTCTLASAGTFTYSDPTVTGTTFQGTLTVTAPAAPETLSLFADPLSVIYASPVTLTGELSSKKAGEDVNVLATPCGRTGPTKVATVQTNSAGEYTVELRTARNTVYSVQAKAITSDVVSVRVRPRLRLGRVSAHHYSLRVFGAQKFAGTYATFQRYSASRSRWLFVKRVLLHANSTNILPTVLSAVAFRATIRPRASIRAILAQPQVGHCYLAGTSNVIRS